MKLLRPTLYIYSFFVVLDCHHEYAYLVEKYKKTQFVFSVERYLVYNLCTSTRR